jgi:hypothetical protein
MKAESVGWSLGKSLDSVIDIWSVAATVEAILFLLAEDNREKVAAVFAQESPVVAQSLDPADSRPAKRKRSASKRVAHRQ